MIAMAKKESSLKNMLIALFVITAVSGGLLGLVYGMTKDTIAEVDAKKNAQAIAEVLGTDENSKLDTITIDDLFYNLAYDAQDNFLGAAVKTYSNAGFNGRIELMVGILADGTIKAVSVLQQSETPGLGANMVNPKFKDQFNGKNPASYDLKVSKDGGDVDAITAATISSRAFTGAVKLACDGFEANKAKFMKGGNVQ
jgi:electron transport complex protein RnfG